MRTQMLLAMTALLAVAPERSARATEPSSAPTAPPAMPNERETVLATQIELQIDLVVPMSQYQGEALLAAVDPRFILVGQVRWMQKPTVFTPRTPQAFAIHSPTQLGLNGWRRGSTICLLLTRTQSAELTYFRLSALKPDAGCHGGG